MPVVYKSTVFFSGLSGRAPARVSAVPRPTGPRPTDPWAHGRARNLRDASCPNTRRFTTVSISIKNSIIIFLSSSPNIPNAFVDLLYFQKFLLWNRLYFYLLKVKSLLREPISPVRLINKLHSSFRETILWDSFPESRGRRESTRITINLDSDLFFK